MTMGAVPYSKIESSSPKTLSPVQNGELKMKTAAFVAFILAAAATATLVYNYTYTERTTAQRITVVSKGGWRAGAYHDKSDNCTQTNHVHSTAAKQSWETEFNASQTIPLKLWQTSRDWNLSTMTLKSMATWRVLNPSLPVALHSDITAAQFINDTFGQEVYDAYRSFPLGVMRADFWRYAILYAHGGIYADIDAKCVKPISSWFPPRQPVRLKDHEVFVKNGTWKSAGGLDHYQLSWWDCSIVIGLENNLHMCNWVIASVPGHPILKEVLQRIVRKAQQGYNLSDIHFVHNHTGPGIWTEAVATVLGLPSQQLADSGARIATAAWTHPPTYRRARSLGVCIVAAPFWGGATSAPQNVQNLFGSLSFDAGYPKWVEEREKLLKAYNEQQAAAAAAAAAQSNSSTSSPPAGDAGSGPG